MTAKYVLIPGRSAVAPEEMLAYQEADAAAEAAIGVNTADIAAETLRAATAEGVIAGNLATETGRATVAEALSMSTVSLDIYADPVTGSDLNDGSSAHPVQTFPAALALIPSAWQRKAAIHLAAGTFTLPDLFAYWMGAPVGVNNQADFDGTAVAFTGGAHGGAGRNIRIVGTYEQVDSGTVTSVTNTGGGRTYRIIDSGKAWTANAQEGLICRITDGTAIGTAFRVRDNTDTMLEALYPMTPAIPVGAHYVLERPASIIQFKQAGFYGVQGAKEQGISFSGIQWKPLVDASELGFYGLTTFHNGITFGDGGSNLMYLVFNDCAGYMCGNRGGENSVVSKSYWVGAFANQCSVQYLGSNTLSTYGGVYILMRGARTLIGMTGPGVTAIFALDSDSTLNVGLTDAVELYLVPSTQAGFASIRFNNNLDNKSGAIDVELFSSLRMGVAGHDSTGTVECNNGAASAIMGDELSMIFLGGNITGSGNANVGLRLERMSRAIVSSGVVVTGAVGNAKAGATVGTWAGIQGGTPLTEAASQTAIVKE